MRFTGLAPVTARIGSVWIGTVAHVRDSVLAQEDLAAEPLVLDSVHRPPGRGPGGWGHGGRGRCAVGFVSTRTFTVASTMTTEGESPDDTLHS